MAAFGYGNVKDRAFVAFERELDDGAWKDIATDAYDASAKENASVLLNAPLPVIWKLRLRMGIASVLATLAAPNLGVLDNTWDASQRRLFHRIAVGIDDPNLAVRNAADRLFAGLLAGTGTAQTQLDYDAEVDFGRQQIALTREGSPLAADAKKLKLGDTLEDIDKATEALAKALGRGKGEKRKSPSHQLRKAVSECASSFNGVHDDLAWMIERTPKGVERDRLEALLMPLEALLTRNPASGEAAAETSEATPGQTETPA